VEAPESATRTRSRNIETLKLRRVYEAGFSGGTYRPGRLSVPTHVNLTGLKRHRSSIHIGESVRSVSIADSVHGLYLRDGFVLIHDV
jgi:hypothetical protein